MGYRKAAMMRRRQYVRGHYRTSKNGNTYWVDGHTRNDYDDDFDGCLWVVAILFIVPVFFLPVWMVIEAHGVAWLVPVLFFVGLNVWAVMEFKKQQGKK